MSLQLRPYREADVAALATLFTESVHQLAQTKLLAEGAVELVTEASKVARPFFEHHGFQVIEEQRVERRGSSFVRYAMRKRVVDEQSGQYDGFPGPHLD